MSRNGSLSDFFFTVTKRVMNITVWKCGSRSPTKAWRFFSVSQFLKVGREKKKTCLTADGQATAGFSKRQSQAMCNKGQNKVEQKV